MPTPALATLLQPTLPVDGFLLLPYVCAQMLRIDLTPISSQPGVISCLLTCGGHAVAATGPHAGDATVLAVLAEALLSAANGLGSRTESGECVEIVTSHAYGGFLLFSNPAGWQMILRCSPAIDLPRLREAAHALLVNAAAPVVPVGAGAPPAQPPPLALADALNVGMP